MLQNPPNNRRLGDEADDLHLPAAFGASKRIDLLDLLDTLPPGRRRNLARAVVGYVQHFQLGRVR